MKFRLGFGRVFVGRVACAIVSFAWIAPLSAQESKDEGAENFREKGLSLVKAWKLAEAENAYREALKAYNQRAPKSANDEAFWPRYYRCHIERAGVFTLMERFAEAEVQLKNILASLQTRPALQRTQARAHEEMAEMYLAMGRNMPAVVQYEEAVRILRKHMEQADASPEEREELAKLLDRCASAQISVARHREAENSYREAGQLWQTLIQAHPKSPDYREGLALALHHFASLTRESGRHLNARDAARSAIQILEELAQTCPEQAKHWHHLPDCHRNLSAALEALHDQAEKKAALRAADAWERKLQRLPEASRSWRTEKDKLDASLQWADAERINERREEAEAVHKKTEKLASDYPQVPGYRRQRLTSKYLLAMRLATSHWFDKALAAYRDALDDNAALVKEFPQVPKYRQTFAAAHVKVAMVQFQKGDRPEGEKTLRAARELFRKLAHDYPDEPAIRLAEEDEMIKLQHFLLARDESQRVIDMIQASAATLKQLAQEHPRCPYYRHHQAATPVALGHMYMHLKRDAEAEKAYGEAIELWTRVLADFPDVVEYQLGACQARSFLLTRDYRKERWAEAETQARAMLSAHRKLIAAAPQVAFFHAGLAQDYCWLAALAERQRQYPKALEHYGQSVVLYQKAFALQPREREHLDLMSKSLRLRGEISQKAGDFAAYERDRKSSRDVAEWLDTPFVRLTRMKQRIEDGKALTPRVDQKREAAEVLERASRCKRLMEQVRVEADDLFDCGVLGGEEWFELGEIYAEILKATDAAQKERYAVRTIASLRKALEDGFLPSVPLGTEEPFRSLAGRGDFRELFAARAKEN